MKQNSPEVEHWFCHIVSILGSHLPPSLVDVLHLIGVVSHARKIDQRQLGSLVANHADVQGLEAPTEDPTIFSQQIRLANLPNGIELCRS